MPYEISCRNQRLEAGISDRAHGLAIDLSVYEDRNGPRTKCAEHAYERALGNIRKSDVVVSRTDRLHDLDLGSS